jgi:hypothetical protein
MGGLLDVAVGGPGTVTAAASTLGSLGGLLGGQLPAVTGAGTRLQSSPPAGIANRCSCQEPPRHGKNSMTVCIGMTKSPESPRSAENASPWVIHECNAADSWMCCIGF